MTKVQDRLIVALDFPTGQEARALVEELGDAVTFYKVGMELFYSEGPAIVSYLKEQGKKVFLDLKLQDIPQYSGAQSCCVDASWGGYHECPRRWWTQNDGRRHERHPGSSGKTLRRGTKTHCCDNPYEYG